MDVVTKATGTVEPVENSTSRHGEFDVILSTSALDRDGDELHADEWKTPLPDKITFDSDHGMSVATCVGSGKPFINDDGQLQVRGTFASTPHGQAVRTLVNEGHIDRVSVAFMEHKTKKDAKPQRELLNGAFVAVPANPEARVLASKSVTTKNPRLLLAGVDAIIDEACDLAEDCDRESLPEPVAQALDLLVGAQQSMDSLMTMLDVYNPDASRDGMEKSLDDAQTKDGTGDNRVSTNYLLSETEAIGDMFQDDAMDSDARPQRKDYWQGIHDVAVKLGAGCPYSDPQATPDVLNGVGNRSVSDALTKSSPSSSADESAAADAKSAAADNSADDAALLAMRLAIKLRGLHD